MSGDSAATKTIKCVQYDFVPLAGHGRNAFIVGPVSHTCVFEPKIPSIQTQGNTHGKNDVVYSKLVSHNGELEKAWWFTSLQSIYDDKMLYNLKFDTSAVHDSKVAIHNFMMYVPQPNSTQPHACQLVAYASTSAVSVRLHSRESRTQVVAFHICPEYQQSAITISANLVQAIRMYITDVAREYADIHYLITTSDLECEAVHRCSNVKCNSMDKVHAVQCVSYVWNFEMPENQSFDTWCRLGFRPRQLANNEHIELVQCWPSFKNDEECQCSFVDSVPQHIERRSRIQIAEVMDVLFNMERIVAPVMGAKSVWRRKPSNKQVHYQCDNDNLRFTILEHKLLQLDGKKAKIMFEWDAHGHLKAGQM